MSSGRLSGEHLIDGLTDQIRHIAVLSCGHCAELNEHVLCETDLERFGLSVAFPLSRWTLCFHGATDLAQYHGGPQEGSCNPM